MPDLSLPTANLLSNTGNAGLILGAFLVLAGTWLAIWASGEKERYSDERIATNETKTELSPRGSLTPNATASPRI
jgi:type II secretory pathway component PulM